MVRDYAFTQFDELPQREVMLGVVRSPRADSKSSVWIIRLSVVHSWQQRKLGFVAVLADFRCLIVVLAE